MKIKSTQLIGIGIVAFTLPTLNFENPMPFNVYGKKCISIAL